MDIDHNKNVWLWICLLILAVTFQVEAETLAAPKGTAAESKARLVVERGGPWLGDVDVRKYFDSIDHAQLRELLARRVTEGVVRRLIDKWLKAGMLEGGQMFYPGATAPLVGREGKIQLSSVKEGLDPFVPLLGETNDVQIEGEVLANSNDCKNDNGNGGNGKRFCEVQLRREIVQASTGRAVASSDVSAPLIVSIGPGKPSLVYSVVSVWDGRLPNGGRAPEGTYVSKLTLWVSRDKPFGKLPPWPLPPDCASSRGGVCKLDVRVFLRIFDLVNQRRPFPELEIAGDCNSGKFIPELCNGRDDNCNIMIDEGAACANRDTACSCQAQSCAQQGITCGSTHNGCGQMLVCGGACP